MSDKTWEKLSHYVGLLPIGALFGLVAFVANIEIKDLDLWLHLGMGKFILEHRYVPMVDVLSCSFAGAPWINHEWLFQVVVYSIFERWGSAGLLNMQITVVCITMAILLLLGYNKQKQLFITLMLFFVFLIFQQRFTIRPDIFSLFFFAIYIFILALHIDKRWALPALFIIQAVWSNMHGFFLLGPIFILIGIVSEWIKRKVPLPYEWNETGRLNDEEFRRLKIIFVFVVLACLINPYFIEGALYPITVLFSLSGENKVFFSVIQELQKPIAWETLFDLQNFIYYKLMILISFVTFIFNRRRIDISALIFWVAFLIFSLQAIRNAIFFGFAAYLVIMTNILTVDIGDIVPIRFTAKKFAHLTAIVCKVLLLFFFFQFGSDVARQGYYDFEKFEHKSEFGGISQRTYPDKAVDFLLAQGIKGNFFNDFNSGAYLVGRAYPNIKAYIDGRTEVYGGHFFNEYQKIWIDGDTDLFEQKVKEHHMTGVLLNSSRQRLPEKLLRYLYKSKEWAVVYFDYDGVIFLKDVEENREIIERFAIDLSTWKAEEADLIKMGAVAIAPYRNYFRADTLHSLELYEPALSELEEALRISPSYGAAYHLYGQIYMKLERYEEAFKKLRIAAALFPQEKQVRLDFADCYKQLKAYDEALKETRQFVATWPSDLNGRYLLVEIYLAQDDFESVLKGIDDIMALKPKASDDLLALGDQALEKKEFDTAEMIYAAALKTDDKPAEAHRRLNQLFLQVGDEEKARFHLEQAGSEPKAAAEQEAE